jgi:hypothetical protein
MQTLILNVPDSLYQDWKREAESSNRSLEEMILELREASRPNNDGINPELQKSSIVWKNGTLKNSNEFWVRPTQAANPIVLRICFSKGVEAKS